MAKPSRFLKNIATSLGLILLSGLMWPAAAPAQYQAPSTRLSPYEQQRYDSSLWQVPREPYQSRFKLEEFKARGYIPPQPEPGPGVSVDKRRTGVQSPVRTEADVLTPSVQSPVRTAPGATPSRAEQRARDRFQTRSTWENQQRQIGERSRIAVPAPPVVPNQFNQFNQPAWPAYKK